MPDLLSYPIARRWPPRHPERLQLYSINSPNGVKVSIMLEEIGLPYEPHLVDIGKDESWTPEFLSLNPNGKIPAVIDPDGPGGQPLALAESGAILIYLADKSGELLGEGSRRYETIQWVMWQMGHVGPMFGQVGFFHRFSGRHWDDKRPLQRFAQESKRLLRVLDERLDGQEWVMGDYSIADISLGGWVRNLVEYYQAGELVDYASLQHVPRWLNRWLERPAVQRGLQIPSKD